MRVTVYLIPIFLIFCLCDGARILGIFNMASKSHHKLGRVLLEALARKGHEVIMVSPYPLKTPTPKYTDIELYGFEEMVKGKEKEFTTFRKNIYAGFKFLLNMTREFTEETLRHPQIKKLVLGTHEPFDLIIMDWFLNEALLILGHVFKAPVVLVSSMGTGELINSLMCNPSPYALVPSKGLGYDGEMSFFQRVSNTLNNIFFNQLIYYNTDYHESILQKYFESPPKFEELINNVALVLSNGHYSFESPRPHVPSIISVGGFHVEKIKPLPKDIKAFLDDAKEGAIYFSLGSHMKSVYLPNETLDAILAAFSKLHPLKIVWKWENEQLKGKPKNVKISNWFPQNDILAHPNIKVFITHGGLLSTIEAVYHGVPMIGIPIFGDQGSNIASAVSAGYAIQINLDDLDENLLVNSVREIMNQTKYRDNIKKRSTLLKDQPLDPMQTAVFWVEHVIRHKGGAHLKNSCNKLSWYQYMLFDVVGFLMAIFIICLTFTIIAAKYLFRLLTKLKGVRKQKKLKKQVTEKKNK